ncbi:phosphoribosylanthranilate isomerase [Prosthecobacter fusiformis]|uniref:N-(5'-phosphoribosyl)anthranilate isomerase n=1 Tax=Prosthecobacter fusiformis TaxID=48464 RepID=A0A4R7S0Z2_9BACT|nr:phosphoribosylanthranilate isomerase [Prosthecobacter fusiformis]TDU70627.1 phosphoribosylanthranilate isomerase [Prosthecobacter fusiformis]
MFPDTATHPAIKICGITQEQQARDIISLGADALGINFWPKSKRYLPVEKASLWLPELRAETTLVAVLVNPDRPLLDLLIQESLVHILQLHGDESPTEVGQLLDAGAHVIKALQVRDRESLEQIGSFPCDTILLDAFNPGLYGGTGETFPWELAVIAQEQFPEKKIILSGGLTPANIREAILQTHPAGVDVASGVESAPGIKDLTMVQEFIEQARLA